MDLFKTVKVCDITIRPRAPAQFNEDIPIAKQVRRRAEKRKRSLCAFDEQDTSILSQPVH